MTVNYRRTSLDRDTTFYVPRVECFACYDSGIVSNGDSFVNQFIPDYDRDRKACWENTAMVQNLVRNKIAKGEKYETPYYIQVVKEELTKVGDMFSFPTEKAIVKSMKKPIEVTGPTVDTFGYEPMYWSETLDDQN